MLYDARCSMMQVGDLAESNVYIGKKIESSRKVGVNAQHIKLSKTATQSQVGECGYTYTLL